MEEKPRKRNIPNEPKKKDAVQISVKRSIGKRIMNVKGGGR